MFRTLSPQQQSQPPCLLAPCFLCLSNPHTHLPEGLHCVGGTTVHGLNPLQAEALLGVAGSVEAGGPATDEPLPLS